MWYNIPGFGAWVEWIDLAYNFTFRSFKYIHTFIKKYSDKPIFSISFTDRFTRSLQWFYFLSACKNIFGWFLDSMFFIWQSWCSWLVCPQLWSSKEQSQKDVDFCPRNQSSQTLSIIIGVLFICFVLFLTEEIQYHDGLRSRELGQAPILLCGPNS